MAEAPKLIRYVVSLLIANLIMSCSDKKVSQGTDGNQTTWENEGEDNSEVEALELSNVNPEIDVIMTINAFRSIIGYIDSVDANWESHTTSADRQIWEILGSVDMIQLNPNHVIESLDQGGIYYGISVRAIWLIISSCEGDLELKRKIFHDFVDKNRRNAVERYVNLENTLIEFEGSMSRSLPTATIVNRVIQWKMCSINEI